VHQYIGIDLHKAKSFMTRLDGRGRVLEQVELVHASGELQQYRVRLPAEARHPDLVLAHPLMRKAIASARIKADKIDATTLAQQLRADLVPAAYIPPRDVQDTREVLGYRASLVRLRRKEKGSGQKDSGTIFMIGPCPTGSLVQLSRNQSNYRVACLWLGR